MNNHYFGMPMQPMQQPNPTQPANQISQQNEMDQLLSAAKNGAIIGGVGAAAINLHHMRNDGMDWKQAAANTVRSSFNAGVATAGASAVGRMFVRQPALSLAATLIAGTAMMYVLSEPKQELDDE